MLKNGIPLTELLVLSPDPLDRELYGAILQGETLSQGLSRLPDFLPREITMVRLAEETGNLAHTFLLIHDRLKEEREMASKIFSVLTYPALLVAAALGFLLASLYLFLPLMNELLLSMGVEYPLLQQLHGFSRQVPPGVLLPLLAFILGAGGRRLASPERLLRRLLGSQWGLYLEAQQMEGLHELLRAGVDILSAFEVLGKEGFPVKGVVTSIRNGVGLREAYREEGASETLLACLFLGEETGNLPEALSTYLLLQKFRFQERIRKRSALVEPGAILLLGILITALSALLLLPMLEAYEGL